MIRDTATGSAVMRVAWDMTHAGRIKTGTGVYARSLLAALEQEPGVQAVPVCQPHPASGGASAAGKVARGLEQVWWTQAGLAREARRQRVDLLHAPAFVSSLFLPCPLVVTVHDLAYMRYPQHFARAWLYYVRLLVPAVVRRARAVITDSHHGKQEVMRYFGTPAERVHAVHLGVDHARFYQMNDRSRMAAVANRFGLRSPFILHTGALAARKNIPALVEAFGRLKRAGACREHRLVLAGVETPGLPGRAAIVTAVERWGLERDVVFLGHVPEETLPALYNLADLLVMPSLYEGFGLPLLEAMACGIPVIASDSSSLPEVVGDAGLLVPPRDAPALAEAIHTALTGAGAREQMIERGLKRAATFTWGRTARETARVYRQVIDRVAAPAPIAKGAEEVPCLPHRSR